jgi:hypothetical protein
VHLLVCELRNFPHFNADDAIFRYILSFCYRLVVQRHVRTSAGPLTKRIVKKILIIKTSAEKVSDLAVISSLVLLTYTRRGGHKILP